MKRNVLLTSIAAAVLLSATSYSFAADSHNNLYGHASTSTAASRTVTIGPETSSVNVTNGDVVKFVCGDKTFAWDFKTAGTVSEIDLNDIAPAGALDHRVRVYLRRDPVTDGG